MLQEERRSKIVQFLELRRSVSVQELIDYLDTSESTIRRDLNDLHEDGRILRVHGGAVYKDKPLNEAEYRTRDLSESGRMSVNREEKERIAKYAAGLIEEYDFVYLDAGSTTGLMIDYISAKSAVFVTNSLNHARKLSDLGFKTYITGGEVKSITELICGEEAVASLEKYNFTKGFFGTNGIHIKRGFTTPDLKEAMVKKTAIERCKNSYILGDSSKFNAISPVSFYEFNKAIILTMPSVKENYEDYSNVLGVDWLIYTLTLNPALDYMVLVEDFKTGLVNRTVAEQILAGGKGINVSTVLSNLNIENTALGFIAGFTGDVIVSMLDKLGVSTDFIKVEEGISRINVKIRSTEETEINGSGPLCTDDDLSKLYKKLDMIIEGDYLVLAGNILKSLNENIYKDIMKYLKDRKVNIIVDTTKKLMLNILEYRPFLIKPNIHELEELFGVSIKTEELIIKYAKALQDMGAQNVLVSRGKDGAILLTKDQRIIKGKPPEGKLVNSVGAGDSMVAGFIAGYLTYSDYEEAYKFAVAAGSASAYSKNLATGEEIINLKKHIIYISQNL